MRTTQSLSITLPHEMAQMVKSKVASGEYATESEVIRDGLRTLAARDAAVEKWLRDEVVPTLKAIKADPAQLVDADQAWVQLSAHMTK
jgi:antitoxin ParD1/3/4